MDKDFSISPFEGTPVLPFSLFFILLFGSLAIITGGVARVIFWVLVFPFAFFAISTLYLRLTHKWGHIHYPLMVRYARAAGLEAGLHPDMNVDDRIDEALILLLKSIYPKMIDVEVLLLYRQLADKVDVFHDKAILTKMLDKKVPSRSYQENEKKAEGILGMYKEGSAKEFKVSAVLAELVKAKYGEDEQLEYMYAVLTGKAK